MCCCDECRWHSEAVGRRHAAARPRLGLVPPWGGANRNPRFSWKPSKSNVPRFYASLHKPARPSKPRQTKPTCEYSNARLFALLRLGFVTFPPRASALGCILPPLRGSDQNGLSCSLTSACAREARYC